MLTPAEADAAIARELARAPDEELPLAACPGRVLRREIHAERDAPPFDRVTMDGIALAEAAIRAGRRAFRVAGVQAAGRDALALASTDDCIEVMTGAPLPSGCDTVVPVERIAIADGRAAIESGYQPVPWLHVHRRAADAQAGDRLLEPGTRLGGPEIAIAASAGLTRLTVSCRPRIAVISTGDELVEPGEALLDHQIRRSNSHALAAALALAGFPPVTDRHLPDRAEAQASAIARELGCHDALVLSGGVSAGRFDHVPSVLEALGVRKVFHQVSQRPGRPFWFGVRDGTAVFALPGNPVSVLVCLARYVIPALRAAAGIRPSPQPVAVLARDYEFAAALSCFLPVTIRYDRDGRTLAEPRPTGGSGDFIRLAGSDGFVELPPGPATHRAGLAVPFFHW